MASRYAQRSNLLFYEVLNEPHGISASAWGNIQQGVINAIREKDTKHTIIVGGVNYNSYNDMATLPVYADQNLIYTFHFYDPFLFTHQGASWTNPSMAPLAGVPFPYNAAQMPTVPAVLKGTWIESLMSDYKTQGTVAKVKELIDVAAAFATQHQAKIYCGEFGVFIPNSDNTQRINWYSEVRTYLEQKKIPWTMWDYTGGFGIFNKDSDELFDYDVNIALVEKLGLQPPAQKTHNDGFQKSGLMIYDDYLATGIVEASFSPAGTLDYYHTQDVKDGAYSILWNNEIQYANIILDFKPNVNLALLPENNYTLDFWIKGNTHGMNFDFRFVDTKKDNNDHPWRFGITVDESMASWDEAWHHIVIPLKDLQEKGSWDNAWFPPAGLFDWNEVDRIEISSENGFTAGTYFLFDDMKISGEPIVTTEVEGENILSLDSYPNPADAILSVEYKGKPNESVVVELGNILGQTLSTRPIVASGTGNVKSNFDVSDLPRGIYVIRVHTGSQFATRRIAVGH